MPSTLGGLWSAQACADSLPGGYNACAHDAKVIDARPCDGPLDDVRVADVAQLVEHFTRNEGVRGSSPRVGFRKAPLKPGSVVDTVEPGRIRQGLLFSRRPPVLMPEIITRWLAPQQRRERRIAR